MRRPPGPARCPASEGWGPGTSSACPCHSHGVTAGGCDSASPGTAVGGGVPALARAEAQRAPWGGPCPGSPSPGRRPPDRPMGGSGRAAGPRPLGVCGRWPAGAPKPPGWLRGDSRPRENMAAPPGVLPEVRATVTPAGHALCCCSVPPRGQCFRCCPDSVQRGMGPSGADGGDLWPPNGASGLCSGRARPPRTPGPVRTAWTQGRDRLPWTAGSPRDERIQGGERGAGRRQRRIRGTGPARPPRTPRSPGPPGDSRL